MDSRSGLASENIRALRHPNHWKGVDGLDKERPLHTMAETHVHVQVLPAATVQLAAVEIPVYRPYETGGVLLAADGAMEVTPKGERLCWGALLADAAGILATVALGALTRAANPWAGEWAGKLEAWLVFETLGVASGPVCRGKQHLHRPRR